MKSLINQYPDLKVVILSNITPGRSMADLVPRLLGRRPDLGLVNESTTMRNPTLSESYGKPLRVSFEEWLEDEHNEQVVESVKGEGQQRRWTTKREIIRVIMSGKTPLIALPIDRANEVKERFGDHAHLFLWGQLDMAHLARFNGHILPERTAYQAMISFDSIIDKILLPVSR